MHLIKFGFTPSYRIWTYHGEKAKKRARKEVRQIQPRGEYDIGFDRCLENLANSNVSESPHVEVETPQDAETSEDPEENTKEYYEALFASQKPLHENTEVTQLDAIACLMALKCHRNLCRDGFDELLVIVGSLLPKGHLLPQNFYYSTKLLSDLKMSSQQIHACPKGCMLTQIIASIAIGLGTLRLTPMVMVRRGRPRLPRISSAIFQFYRGSSGSS
jgi:hypothetical protein